MHKLYEALLIVVDVLEEEKGIIALPNQNQQDGNVELYHILGLRVPASFSFDLLVDEVVEFAEAV